MELNPNSISLNYCLFCLKKLESDGKIKKKKIKGLQDIIPILIPISSGEQLSKLLKDKEFKNSELYCQVCNFLIEDGQSIFQEMASLQQELENIKQNFFEGVRKSLFIKTEYGFDPKFDEIRNILIKDLENIKGEELEDDEETLYDVDKKENEDETANIDPSSPLFFEEELNPMSLLGSMDDDEESSVKIPDESNNAINKVDNFISTVQSVVRKQEKKSKADLKKTSRLRSNISKNKTKNAKKGESKDKDTEDTERSSKRSVKTCSVCEQKFGSTRQLQTHIFKAHTGVKTVTCTVKDCTETFVTNMALRFHVAKMHPALAKFHCPLCPRACAHGHALKAHMITVHSTSLDFSCHICPKAYKSKWALKTHLESHEKHLCDSCGRSLCSKQSLDHHKRSVHAKEKRFNCNLCAYKSFTNVEMNNHKIAKHSEAKTWVCEVCGEGFKLKRRLTIHMTKHGQSLFECAHCDKKFFQSGHLKSHLYTHRPAEDRPFKCSLCFKSFIDRQRLEAHESLHNSDFRPFACTICSRSFTHQKNLYSHNYHVHKKKEH